MEHEFRIFPQQPAALWVPERRTLTGNRFVSYLLRPGRVTRLIEVSEKVEDHGPQFTMKRRSKVLTIRGEKNANSGCNALGIAEGPAHMENLLHTMDGTGGIYERKQAQNCESRKARKSASARSRILSSSVIGWQTPSK